jgi:putative FmdB family regulatory protein
MPIYEFQCEACKKRYSALVGMTAEPDDTSCPACGHQQGRKLVSRVGRFRTEDARIDEMADRLETMGEPDDPSEVRQLVREMGKAMDDDMSDEMEEMFEADLAGDAPDEF